MCHCGREPILVNLCATHACSCPSSLISPEPSKCFNLQAANNYRDDMYAPSLSTGHLTAVVGVE